MIIVIKTAIFILNIIFSILKLLPVQKKITYISRQMNETPIDFQMVINNFQKKDSSYQHVVLAKMIPQGIVGKIGYCFHIFRQMYHIATSQAVILDTYCIPISILNQRESLVVIQMWHALGAFKKFGYSILNQEEGSSSKIAKLMKMHYHYTYVLTSSEYTASFFAEAFHVPLDKMKVFPLPKTDLLIDESLKKDTIEHIYQEYPQLRNTTKKIIVYAPTFRKNNNDELYRAIIDLIHEIDYDKYEFVLKKHPLTELRLNDSKIIEDQKFSSLEFFHLADYIITDYSATLFEAAMLNKPLYFYAFDYDEYMNNRSFYIDYYLSMPGPVIKDAKNLMNIIENLDVDYEKIENFKNQMVSPCKVSYTDDFVDFLLSKI